MATTVLHVTSVEFSVRTLLLPQMWALRDRGFDVRVACMPEQDSFGPELAPFEPVRLAIPRSTQPLGMARATVDLLRIVRSMKPRLVHLHSASIALPGRLIPRWAMPGDVAVGYTVHGFLQQWDPPMSTRDRFLDRVECLLSHRADFLLFQSKEDFDQARARGYGSRLVYLGNGVQDHWFDVPPPRRHRPLRLLFVGRVVREKGILVLIEAISRVPDVRVTIVGGEARAERGGLGDEVVDLIEARGLQDRVELVGLVSPPEVPAIMAEHDAFVLPTFHHEGVPRSIIEAMAASRPVITTFRRGCRELVDDGWSGFVVAQRSVDELAEAIRRLDSLDDAEFTLMSSRARETADRVGRESRVIERLVETYKTAGVVP